MTIRKWTHNLIAFILTVSVVFIFSAGTGFCAEGYEKVSGNSQNKPVARYGMVPIYGNCIKDGTYPVEAESSSSYFRLKDAELSVKKGEMTAVFTIDSLSYSYIYLGTGEEAAGAELSEYIAPETREGVSVFQIPVEALNQEISCAAFSKRRDTWYDRTILFDASSLPENTVSFEIPDYDLIDRAVHYYNENNGKTEAPASSGISTGKSGAEKKDPVSIDMEDGTYSIEVNMTGGSGRASVSSPTWMIVKDGKAYARLMWSSSYYDYMIVGGKKYLNETTDGGSSTFTIPITAMDQAVSVIGDTTAMDEPVEVEYDLTFYRDTIGSKRQIPQEAAKMVLVIALIIIVLGGILNFLVKRKKKA